jgi:tripartite-type tricarboxylate transporter receptor subunit TctC
VTRIAADLERILRDGFTAELEQRGLAPEGLGPAEFRAFIEAEVAKWGRVAERAGIQPG